MVNTSKNSKELKFASAYRCFVVQGLRAAVLIGIAGTCLGAWIKVAAVAPDRFWVAFLGQSVVALSQIFILSIPARLAAVWFGPEQVSSACSIGVFGNQVPVISIARENKYFTDKTDRESLYCQFVSRNRTIIFRFNLWWLLEQNLFLIEIYISSISGHKPTLLFYRLLGGLVMLRDVSNCNSKAYKKIWCDMQNSYDLLARAYWDYCCILSAGGPFINSVARIVVVSPEFFTIPLF